MRVHWLALALAVGCEEIEPTACDMDADGVESLECGGGDCDDGTPGYPGSAIDRDDDGVADVADCAPCDPELFEDCEGT